MSMEVLAICGIVDLRSRRGCSASRSSARSGSPANTYSLRYQTVPGMVRPWPCSCHTRSIRVRSASSRASAGDRVGRHYRPLLPNLVSVCLPRGPSLSVDAKSRRLGQDLLTAASIAITSLHQHVCCSGVMCTRQRSVVRFGNLYEVACCSEMPSLLPSRVRMQPSMRRRQLQKQLQPGRTSRPTCPSPAAFHRAAVSYASLRAGGKRPRQRQDCA